jgi:hypothetical protein
MAQKRQSPVKRRPPFKQSREDSLTEAQERQRDREGWPRAPEQDATPSNWGSMTPAEKAKWKIDRDKEANPQSWA